MRHVTWLSRKLRDIEAGKSARLCVRYFVNFSKHFSQYFCCWGYPRVCNRRYYRGQVTLDVLMNNADTPDLQMRKTPGGHPLLLPADPGLAGDAGVLLPQPPLPGQGSHRAGHRPHHPDHHALPQGDLHPTTQGTSLHHKLSLLEWRNIPHVYCGVPSSLEAGHYSRFQFPPISHPPCLVTSGVTYLACFEVHTAYHASIHGIVYQGEKLKGQENP